MFLTGGLMLTVLSGCGGPAEPNAVQPPLETAAYSNLTDAVSRGLLSESLADSGISENRVSILLDRVDQFNASVKNEWLTEGFESGALTDTKYDPYEMQELWTEKNGSFPGYNCRITAFSLFGAFVTAGADQPETQGEDTLFLDLETLAADPAVLCGDSTSKFCALFAPVAAADSTETAEQVKALRAGWAERGVAFEEGTARLISVVLHDRFSDTDNTLFIGHVGVLLPAEDEGTFRIWYNAYPTRITAETAADFPIDLHEEAAHYVAHYMAGQLYKHDDISIAQIYMNEFFEWMERLAESGRKADGRNAGSGGWVSVKGYY